MRVSEAPSYGSFTFRYKDTNIYVPTYLNKIARYKPDSFWDWLIFIRFPTQNAIVLAAKNLDEEEQFSKDIKQNKLS
jgi:hypothetical protein